MVYADCANRTLRGSPPHNGKGAAFDQKFHGNRETWGDLGTDGTFPGFSESHATEAMLNWPAFMGVLLGRPPF